MLFTLCFMGFSQTEQATEVVVETQYGPRIVSDHQVVVSDVEPFRLPGHRNPRLAGWLSAAVPGAGQIYNGQWWKVPIIYGGATGLFLWGRFERSERNAFQDEFLLRTNQADSSLWNPNFVGWPDQAILSGRNFHRRNLELVYVFSALLYILNIVDAVVFAHLATFDVSDNLAMRVEPFALPDASFHALNNQRVPMQGGLRLTFTLK